MEGKLYLTNTRLVFKPHRMKDHEWSLLNQEIQMIHPYQSAGLPDNGLIIRSASGQEETFVVEHPDKWLSFFSQLNNPHA